MAGVAFVLLFLLSALWSLASCQPQYVTDGGFESNSLNPNYVTSRAAGVSCAPYINTSSTPSHTGRYSLVMSVRSIPQGSNAFANISQVVTVPAGDTLTLSFWYNMPITAYPNIAPLAFFNGVPVPLTTVTPVSTTTAIYVKFAGTFAVPVDSGGTGTVMIASSVINSGSNIMMDDVTLLGASIVGDPRFVGLRGQSYQVHGVDGEVYNLITSAHLQVNSRFVFLDSGKCPIVDGVKMRNCWTHPGSYLGSIGIQQRLADGTVEQLAIISGDADTGFASVELNGELMDVEDEYTNDAFSVTYRSAYVVDVITELFSFRFDNSDLYINQQVVANVALSSLTAHGLFGQTHSRRTYPNTAIKYIEGAVDDYVVQSNDLRGNDFVYNLFHHNTQHTHEQQ